MSSLTAIDVAAGAGVGVGVGAGVGLGVGAGAGACATGWAAGATAPSGTKYPISPATSVASATINVKIHIMFWLLFIILTKNNNKLAYIILHYRSCTIN